MVETMKDDRQQRWSPLRIGAWSAAAILLLVPLVAMQFTDEVVWDAADFIVAGGLLLGTGITFELAAKMTNNTAYRAAVGVGLLSAFALVWVSLAVGIIGSENNDANLMYVGVLAVGAIGAAVAGLKPKGMARAMAGVALAQVLVAVIAVVGELGTRTGEVQSDVIIMTVFFTALWLTSAALFWKAARA